MKHSTSFHTINADTQKHEPWRLLHRLCNLLNNCWFPNTREAQLCLCDYVTAPAASDWQRLDFTQSPVRLLSDLFWLTLPWQALHAEFGPLHIVDTGCGNGAYGAKLQGYAAHTMASYTGLDLRHHEHWAPLMATHANLRFAQIHGTDIAAHIPAATNMFITQSALEHFAEDLTYFQHVQQFIRRTTRPVLQVHQLPAAACWRLYPHHGIRQYTPRTISSITRLFHDNAYAVLYKLGGQACNALHRRLITRPPAALRHYRQQHPRDYQRRVRTAICTDMAMPQRAPSFYALVIHSHWRQRLFS